MINNPIEVDNMEERTSFQAIRNDLAQMAPGRIVSPAAGPVSGATWRSRSPARTEQGTKHTFRTTAQ